MALSLLSPDTGDHTVFLHAVLQALMTSQSELAFDIKSICHLGACVIFLKTKFDCVFSLTRHFFCLPAAFRMNSASLARHGLGRLLASPPPTSCPHTWTPGNFLFFSKNVQLLPDSWPSTRCSCFLDFPLSFLHSAISNLFFQSLTILRCLHDSTLQSQWALFCVLIAFCIYFP